MNSTIERFDASCFDGYYCTGVNATTQYDGIQILDAAAVHPFDPHPGDIDDAYLQRLEDKGRGAGRDRPGQDLKDPKKRNGGAGSTGGKEQVYV